MSWISLGADSLAPRTIPRKAASSDEKSVMRLRVAGIVLRTIFIVSLLIVTIHVSLPQTEAILTVYNSPGDLIRLVLGFVACAWVGTQLFAAPGDVHAHRTWLYLGLAAVPFAAVCIVYIW